MNLKYQYDFSDKTWKTGSINKGIGIFKDNCKWQANVVLDDIWFIGPFDSFKETKQNAKKKIQFSFRILWRRIKCLNNYQNKKSLTLKKTYLYKRTITRTGYLYNSQIYLPINRGQ